MNRRLKWIVIALILVFLGVMIYKYYLAAPAPQQEIDSNVLSAEQEINSGLENKESMWILFVSASCEPCAEMHEIFKQLKPKYSGKVKFIEVDVNDRANFKLVQQYKLQYVPTNFIVDSQGNTSYHNVGVIALDRLQAELDRVVRQ